MKKLIAISFFLVTAAAGAKGYSSRPASFDVTFTVAGHCTIDGSASGGAIECSTKVPYLLQRASNVQSGEGKASLLNGDTVYF